MYCPQCGQQQASSEMRFCSRCGFPMGGVAELLAQGGMLRSGSEEAQEQTFSPRRRGVRQGVLMMLIGAVLVPVLAILNGFMHGPNILDLLVPISAVLCFAGGLMRILYAVIYEESASGTKRELPAHLTSSNACANQHERAWFCSTSASEYPCSEFRPTPHEYG
jgi:hypothetical protein